MQRFVREGQLAATLDHPNIVTLLDFFEWDGVPYLAMEYVAGGSLRPLVRSISVPQVFGVLEGVLAALDHAESHGVAHRDLKPENVLVTGGGGIKVADFGIARAYNRVTPRLTETGAAIGTPTYMAPEQAQNLTLGPSTDIYSVGVLAYEMLAGRPPFDPHEPPIVVLYQHVNQPVPPLSELAPSTPPALSRWVEWLLAKDPAERPQSGAEAWRALEEIAVRELDPYWRRKARVLPHEPGAEPVGSGMANTPSGAVTARLAPSSGAGTRPATPAVDPPASDHAATAPARAVAALPDARPRLPLRRFAALAATIAAGAAAIVVLASNGGDPRRGHAADSLPYDFDGDRRQELVIGLPGWSVRGAAGGGVAVVDDGHPTLMTATSFGVPGEPQLQDGFGSGITSADFDGDGRADLAVGAPGTNIGDPSRSEGIVSVLYGSARGLGRARRQTLGGSRLWMPYRKANYGAVLAGADLNADGFDDLVVGAPGANAGAQRGSGAIHVLPGGGQGLRVASGRALGRPRPDTDEFGSRVRLGDVDGDGDLDVVEAAPARGGGAVGHVSWCPGGPGGPRACRLAGPPRSVAALSVADVDGDGYADVIEGDPGPLDARTSAAPRGRVRIYRGGSKGPSSRAITLRQPNDGDQPGDGYGTAVAAGDLNGDRVADLVVGAPGVAASESRVTIIFGGPDLRAGRKSSQAGPTGSAGRTVGRGLSVLQLTGDHALDLAVGVTGPERDDIGFRVFRGGGTRLVGAPVRMLEQVAPAPGTAPGDTGVRLGRPAVE